RVRHQSDQWGDERDALPLLGAERDLLALALHVRGGHEAQRYQQHDADDDELVGIAQPAHERGRRPEGTREDHCASIRSRSWVLALLGYRTHRPAGTVLKGFRSVLDVIYRRP